MNCKCDEKLAYTLSDLASTVYKKTSSISTSPLSAKYPAVAMEVVMLTMNMNVVEVIRKDSNSRHKVELDPVVVILHTVQTNTIVVMDLSRILELVKLIFLTQMKKDLVLLDDKMISIKRKFCIPFN